LYTISLETDYNRKNRGFGVCIHKFQAYGKGKEKNKKKWYTDNVDSQDLDSALEEDVEVHSDLDLNSWDDGSLGVRDLDGKTNHSPCASRRDHVRDLEDEYTFRGGRDDHLTDLPSIAEYVNGDGLLNSNNIF
jgi:hypothetical protein